MASQTLLKGGTLLIHDEKDHVIPTKADLLVEGCNITQIGGDISITSTATVIDCTGKLVAPGFVNTHQHTWQTQLKGTHADHTLVNYFVEGNFSNSLYSPEDVFWGQLGGCLESIDAGTTTVVDHATVTYSPEHPLQAIRATVTSGIRCIFGFCPTPRVESWKPSFALEQEMFPPWVMQTWDKLAAQNPFGPNGRVRLGFAFDGLWLPGSFLRQLFEKVRQQGSHLITSHSMRCAIFGGIQMKTSAQILHSHNLLAPDILLSHANNPNAGDADLFKEFGARISSTPSTECQMGHGNPVCLEPEFYTHSSLGIDCHSLCSSFLPSQMMLAIQTARARQNEALEVNGQWSSSLDLTVEQVYNLGTILGARAAGIGEMVGSLAKGKKADILIFEDASPSMAVASKRDPVAAIVFHSSVRDLSTVFVDGVMRKNAGKLLAVEELSIGKSETSGRKIEWPEVAREVEMRAALLDDQKKRECDIAVATDGVIDAFHLNRAGMVLN